MLLENSKTNVDYVKNVLVDIIVENDVSVVDDSTNPHPSNLLVDPIDTIDDGTVV